MQRSRVADMNRQHHKSNGKVNQVCYFEGSVDVCVGNFDRDDRCCWRFCTFAVKAKPLSSTVIGCLNILQLLYYGCVGSSKTYLGKVHF